MQFQEGETQKSFEDSCFTYNKEIRANKTLIILYSTCLYGGNVTAPLVQLRDDAKGHFDEANVLQGNTM